MSSSSDEISSEEEVEYLMSTRAHRANAGNKMKKLLEQELEDMRSRTDAMDEDELDLLFQEEDNDEDFEFNSEEGEREEEEEEEEEEREEEGKDDEEREKSVEETLKVSEVSPSEPKDDDLMLTESEEESGVSEEDEGEKELQNEERLQNRQKRKKQKAPVVIRRKIPKIDGSSLEPKKKKYEQTRADTLLTTERRTSKRSSVVANKLKVYEKLSIAEEKRKLIQERIRKHKQEQQEKELTQEDRMRIALETEEFNLKSLNKYKEQEISKKLSRMAAQQRQKQKFKNGEIILQTLTTYNYVTPIMEIEDRNYWDEEVKRREKKKKRKYTRRKLKQIPDEKSIETNSSEITKENTESSVPEIKDDLNTDEKPQPFTDENDIDSQEQKNQEVISLGKAESLPSSPKQEGETMAETVNINVNESDNEKNSMNNQKETKKEDINATDEREENKKEDEKSEEDSSNLNMHSIEVKNEAISKSSNDQFGSYSKDISNDSNNEINERVCDENTNIALTEEKETVVKEVSISSEKIKEEEAEEIGTPTSMTKQVSFAEEPEINIIDNETAVIRSSSVDNTANLSSDDQSEVLTDSTDITEVEPMVIYEGPEQLVSKNYVSIYKFPDFATGINFESELFGNQWNNPAVTRTFDVEPICRINMPEEAHSRSTKKTTLIPDLSFLSSFPCFGEYDKKIVRDTNDEDNNNHEIEIKTQPPTGVLLPNSTRKKCLITNKECQYFDPKNGVPYSDVDAYKIIQELQDPIGIDGTEDEPDPHYYWYGFGDGGIYLDLKQKPAKGVPEGFQ
ncbi:hypothetical protein Kpol_1053p30 [Vanderwaltozyma polyspora DSM 70294]|uniref:Vps72/YL1 C-terminal domain-containing protein n=1 Tax=Vanderwaltozyma polyspora (strain ATCC 22028 / DSM 70294 / BCRC 21397 / CBS 2163 / NBRC 10782 / NRRL Y-8283 / UCD 57-17) TaxID=436907 RepID=A7TN75_VANPO|nr:uncharacterized protein Kpol_1053p30 [Vanderwaltozyma polyspora DSM 70294]EDO16293.1 hypothetical protein Kpol_1053p30 [Vanderwaltozyma polyspora DSM 70294]